MLSVVNLYFGSFASRPTNYYYQCTCQFLSEQCGAATFRKLQFAVMEEWREERTGGGRRIAEEII